MTIASTLFGRSALFFGYALLMPILLHAQSVGIDSLKRAYRAAPDNLRSLSSLNDLNDALLAAGRLEELKTSALEQERLAIVLLGERGLTAPGAKAAKAGLAKANRLLGACAFHERAIDEALERFRASLMLWEELGDVNGMNMAHWNIGTVHMGRGDLEAALAENLLALDLRKQLGDTLLMARSHNNIGVIRYELGDYQGAMKDHLMANALWTYLGDTLDLSGSENNIGALHIVMGDHPEAIRYFRRAYELALAMGDERGIITFHNNMGEVEDRWGDHAKALDHYYKALAKAEQLGDVYLTAFTYFNIGKTLRDRGDAEGGLEFFGHALSNFAATGDQTKIAECHRAIGGCHTALGQYDQALASHSFALEVQRQIGARPGEVRTLINIGQLHMVQGSIREAMVRFDQALAVNADIGDPVLEADAQFSKGEAFMALGEWEKARRSLETARNAAQDTGYRKGLVAAHGALARVHRALGQNGEAYEHHVLYASLKDSLFNEESSRRIDELRMRYEVDLKDNELELLNRTRELQEAKLDRQRITLYYLIAGFLLLLVFGWVATRLYLKHRRAAYERIILETEHKALRAQMNPHFIFNVLNSIQFFATRNDLPAVVRHLKNFTRLIRAILEQSRTPFIQLAQELSTLKLYLELEKVRFEDQFEYTVEVDPALEPERIRIPGMLVQPIVENAIKHGISHKLGEARVDLRFQEREGTLLCTVTDNGIGREASQKLSANGNGHLSAATTIIQERMDALSAIHKIRLACTTHDLYGPEGHATGTRVVIELPIERLN
jgi:tetratricopeptide (TPR) repeat protein